MALWPVAGGGGSVSGFSLARQAADAFNRHGSLTARLVEHVGGIEIRNVDSGEYLTTLCSPAADNERWTWRVTPNGEPRTLDSGFRIEQVVRVVATSLLDERPNR